MLTGLASQQEDISLVGVMSEFRVALREEIEASHGKASSDAIPLVNGRRVAQVGGRYLFTFEIESALNLPGPAPGDLHVPSPYLWRRLLAGSKACLLSSVFPVTSVHTSPALDCGVA